MKVGHGGDEAQSKAVSGRVAALLEPVKPLEDMVAFARRNSGPVIGDRKDGLFVDVFAGNDDLATGATVLDGIVHEVGDGIDQQIAVAGHSHLAIACDGK